MKLPEHSREKKRDKMNEWVAARRNKNYVKCLCKDMLDI